MYFKCYIAQRRCFNFFFLKMQGKSSQKVIKISTFLNRKPLFPGFTLSLTSPKKNPVDPW